MTYNEKAIEQGQMRLALEHKQRMIARQAEIHSVESVVMKSDTMEIIVTMQNGAIEPVDFPTAESESIMRIRIAYLVVCLYPDWQYVNWDWEGKLQILKREESKCRTQ